MDFANGDGQVIHVVFTVRRGDTDLSQVFGLGETLKNYRLTVEEI